MSDGNSSKGGFSRTQKTHHPEKETGIIWIIFHLKIEQTIKKTATEVVNENLYWEVIFR